MSIIHKPTFSAACDMSGSYIDRKTYNYCQLGASRQTQTQVYSGLASCSLARMWCFLIRGGIRVPICCLPWRKIQLPWRCVHMQLEETGEDGACQSREFTPPFNSQRPPGTAYTVVWDRPQPLTKPNLLFEILVLHILYLYYRRFHSFL